MTALYGRVMEETTAWPTPTPTTTPSPFLATSEICSDDFKMDTIVETYDNRTYVFSGHKFWLLNKAGTESGQPIQGNLGFV
jgi:hypothetical protein